MTQFSLPSFMGGIYMCGSILVEIEGTLHFHTIGMALPDSGCLRETLFQHDRLQDAKEDRTISER